MKGQSNLCKFLTAGLFVCVFTLGLSPSAGAVTVDFHGKALTGVINTSNAKVLDRAKAEVDSDSATIGVGKFRLRAEVGTDDGRAKMVYGFETGANNFGGDEWDYSGDSQDFENRFAYIQSAFPGINDNIYARMGLQKTAINHWVWTETAAGITLHGEGKINWETGWFRGLEGDEDNDKISDAKDDTDLFVAKAEFQPLTDVKVGGFGIYAFDFEAFENVNDEIVVREGTDQYWLGLTGKVGGPVFASGDLIYQGGKVGAGADGDVSAYLVNLTMGAKLNDSQRLSFNALYVSGDDDNDIDQDEFHGIDADVNVGQIFFKDSLAASLDRYVKDQPYKLANGLINLAVEGEMKLDAKNKIRAAARYLASAEDDPAYNDEDELGYELDLWYTYKMNKNLAFKVEGAYLFPGDLAEGIFADDGDVYLATVGAVFKF